jgi:hypothetical protein
MYAEIRITVAEGLSSSLERQAREWFSPTVLPVIALAQSELDERRSDLTDAVIAKLAPSNIVIVWRDDAVTLRAFVQLNSEKPTLSSLKDHAADTAGDVTEFLRAHGTKVAGVTIRIYAEGEHIETGRRVTWWDRLTASARQEAAGRLSVPLSTFLLSLALDSNVPNAATSAAAAFVGVLMWLLVSATLEKPGYKYE